MLQQTYDEFMQTDETAIKIVSYLSKRERNFRGGEIDLDVFLDQMRRARLPIRKKYLLPVLQKMVVYKKGSLDGNTFVAKGHLRNLLPRKRAIKNTKLVSARPSGPIPLYKKIFEPLNLGPNKALRVEFTPNLTEDDIDYICFKLLRECT